MAVTLMKLKACQCSCFDLVFVRKKYIIEWMNEWMNERMSKKTI